MSRRFSAKTEDEALARASGKCEMCGGLLKPGKYEFDHRKPHALGGESTLANCVVACRACHIAKSQDDDMPQIRKADRKGKRPVETAEGKTEIQRRYGV